MDALKEFLCPVLLWGGLGLLFSLAVGHFVVGPCFMKKFKKHMKLRDEDLKLKTKAFPTWLSGCIERAIFTIWVGAAGPGSAVVLGMGAWLGLKMATNWNRRQVGSGTTIEDRQRTENVIRASWLGLMSGVVSMVMAFIGGLIIWWGLRAVNLPECGAL